MSVDCTILSCVVRYLFVLMINVIVQGIISIGNFTKKKRVKSK